MQMITVFYEVKYEWKNRKMMNYDKNKNFLNPSSENKFCIKEIA